MAYKTPHPSAAAVHNSARHVLYSIRYRLMAVALATMAVCGFMFAPLAQAAATEPMSCDLVAGTVEPGNRLGLRVAVSNAAGPAYTLVLFNQGPVGLQSVFSNTGSVLVGDFDKVDVGYSGRRAVEQGVSATFTAAVSSNPVAPSSENSTFCTGTVSLVDNPTDGTAFVVRH